MCRVGCLQCFNAVGWVAGRASDLKNMGGMVEVGTDKSSRDGVAPSRMVGVSASVNLPLHHKMLNYSPGTDSPEWSRKKGR